MKIAWCHNAVTGGAKRAAYEYVRELARRGHTLEEFIIADEPVEDYLPLAPFVRATRRTIFSRPGIVTLRPYLLETTAAFAARWVNDQRIERALRQVAEKIERDGFDLVHIDQHPFCWTAGLLPYLRRPAVVYSHEASNERYLTSRSNAEPAHRTPLRRWYWRFCRAPLNFSRQLERRQEAWRLRHVPLMLTNSRFSAEVWSRHGIAAKICYYGVDDERFRPFGLAVEPFILSVGRLVQAKCHDLVIESVALIPAEQRPRVVVAAPEPDRGQRTVTELHALAKARGVSLEIVHAPDQDTLVRWYNRALAVAFVPLQEPFGLVAIEAMSCGTPVIGVREGGLLESVVDGSTGLLVDRDPRRIAEAIRTLQTQPELRVRMGRQAVEHIRAQWTWSRAVDRYESAVLEHLSSVGFKAQSGLAPDLIATT